MIYRKLRVMSCFKYIWDFFLKFNFFSLLLKVLIAPFLFSFFATFPLLAQTAGPAGIRTNSSNVLWLRSDQGTSTITNGQPLSSWDDISGNANHSAQSNGTFQPLFISSGINGFPSLRFDGTNDYLIVPDADNLDNTTGVSVFVVAQPDNPDTSPRGLVSKRASAGSQEAYYLFTYTNQYLYFNASTNRINGADAVTDQPQIFSAVFNGAVANPRSRIFLDGDQSGSGNGPTSIGNMASDLYIGTLNVGYPQGFQGDVSEVIVFRDALNLAERSIVEAYLGNRYNITLGPVNYSSATHIQDFTGIGHSGGEKYSNTQDLGSGLLLSERNNSLDETNEFVLFGHDGTPHGIDNSDLPTIPGVNLDDRWQRIYYVERVQDGVVDAGSTDVRFIFDFDGTGIPLATNRVYYLLYRSGTSGEFSEVPGAAAVASEGKVSLNVSDANFATGYYTLAKSDQEIRTWYSLNDGNWDNPNTWSLNPNNEPNNPSSDIPGTMDRAVIQDNKTVTVILDNTSSGVLDVISGTVDFGTTTGNSFGTITGQAAGRIRLAADNFPSGDATGFANAATGGTVEYYGSGYDLTTARTFRNVRVNMNNNADQLILLANYSIHGDLFIDRGELHFGDGAFAVARNVTVYESVFIQPNGKIRTGTANARHQFNLYGDFTNQGDVQFTNRVAVNYTAEATNGIVDVNFRSATRNQNALLEGPTRFYRIAVEKGTSSTYELFIEATNPAYFELFGYANQGHPDNAQLAVNNNAFGLAYGTARIGANITIARLNGGGNYNVSENAILWVDGGSVSKPTGTGEAVVVYGRVKVSSGQFISDAPSGITTRLNGVFESTGGFSRLRQFRTSVLGTQHIGGYIQSGGDVLIDGDNANTSYYSFTLSYGGNVFELSGGTLTIEGTNTRGAVFINSDEVNQNVSANANLVLRATSNRIFRITSKSPLPNVTLSRTGAGDRNFVLEGGNIGTNPGNQAEMSAQPLIALGSFIIDGNIVFDPRGEDVTIGRNYAIAGGSSYIAGSNNTIFSGTIQNYTIDIDAGANTKYFHNLTVNNSGFTGSLTGSDIIIGNNLLIENGTLSLTDRVVTVRGDISNSGVITTTTGKILITQRGRVTSVALSDGGSYTSAPTISFSSGTATAVAIFNGTPSAGNPLPISEIIVTNSGFGYTSAPTVNISGGGGAVATATIGSTHELGGDGSGIFGNLEIDEIHPGTLSTQITYLSAKQTVTGIMTLTNGIFDLRTHNLDVEGSLSNNTIGYYSNTRMFRTAGNHGDGGLTLSISTDGTYLFPIGTINHDNSVYRYAWANPTFSNVTSEGKVQINGVPRKLATLSDDVTPPERRYLLYYWRVRHSDFSVLPNVTNLFIGYKDDIFGQTNWANIFPGKVINNVRSLYGVRVGVNNADTNTFDYTPEFLLEAGEFTAGRSQVFQGSVQVFYSRLSTSNWYALTSNWNNGNNWSFEPHNGSVPDNRAPAGDFPQIGDIAVIGYGGHNSDGGYHSMNILATEVVECADIQFIRSPIPGAYQSRLVLRVGGGNAANLTAGIIQGDGTFMLRVTPGLFPTASADFSEFVNEELAVFNYYLEANGDYNIPTGITTEYPNLRIEGGGGTLGNRRATIQEDFWVKRNFTIDQGAEFITHNGVEGNFQVDNFLYLGGGTTPGRLSLNTSGSLRTLTINNILLRNNANNAIRVINSTPSSLEHRILLSGGITQTNGQLNLYNVGAGSNNLILELIGESDASLTITAGTIPSLYKLIVNKGNSQLSAFTIDTNFSLNGPTNGSTLEKALQLQNGRLVLNDPAISIDLSTGGGNFFIPSTSGLIVQSGQANVSGANSGILLDGLLRIETDGSVNMDGGIGINNFLEYSSSGNATLEVTGGSLIVGSQLRRGTSNSSGILRYTQTGGAVIVGKNAAPTSNRGVFEILNASSNFTYTGGSLTIVRPQTSATEASLLLEPSTSNAGNATIQIGNDDTPASSIITLKTNAELGNLLITGVNNPTARLRDRSLVLNGNLTIDTGSTFDGNSSFNLTVNGHLTNNGTTSLNTDTLFLRGTNIAPSVTMQEIAGSLSVNHLVIEPQASVELLAGSDLEINGDLFLNEGQLIDGGNTITVRGNVTNTASHISTNPLSGGLVFNGTSLQRLFGTGQFGRIEINNVNGVQLENSLSLNNHLTLTNGILQLQSNKLTLGLDADIFGGPFDDNKMIAVGGGDFLQGIQKTFPTVAESVPADPYDENDPAYSYTFTFPIGVDNGSVRKYTPVEFYVASSNTQGTISLHPVNRKHITLDDTQTDVLQYYWIITSAGLSNFSSLIHTHYKNADVVGDESAYIGARLLDNFWAKYLESPGPPPIEVVYENDDYIAFVYSGANRVDGEYTAGIEPHIPDEVPIFFSRQDGDWTDPNTWERQDAGPVPAGGPSGQRVHIRTAHTVTITTNFRRAYRTTINGRLEVGTTINHILGYVNGTGTLSSESSSLPSGNYDEFFACGTGGTMEWAGGTYGLPSSITNYNNLTITGTGTKTFPNVDVTICGDLRIEGNTYLKMTGTTIGYRYTYINGNVFLLDNAVWDHAIRVWIRLRGNFEKVNTASLRTAYTAQRFEIEGSIDQVINGNFAGLNAFNNLAFRNPGIIELRGPVDVRTFLVLLSQGRVQTSQVNLLSLNRTNNDGQALQSVDGLIEGPIRKI
jgi:hypothetical protein